MTIQLFSEETTQTRWRDRMRARRAILASSRLAKAKPERIERVIGKWASKYPVTDMETARTDRAAVCTVSERARSQEGCLLRSIAVARAAKYRRRSITWCSGFALEPFRGHAWVEVGGVPVSENVEIADYTKSLEVRARGDADVSAASGESAGAGLLEPDRMMEPPPAAPVRPRDLFGLAKDKRLLVVAALMALVGSGLTLLIPGFIAKFFSDGSFSLPSLGWIGVFLGVLLASGVAMVFQYYYLQKVGETIVRDARGKLSNHLLRLQIKEYDERSAGDLVSRVAADTSSLRTGFLQIFVACTTGFPLVIGTCALMLFLDPFLMGTALALIVGLGFVLFAVSRLIQGASLVAQQKLGSLTSQVQRDMGGIRTIRATNATDSEASMLESRVEDAWQAGLKMAKVQSIVSPIANIGFQLSAIVVILVGAYRTSIGAMSISELVQFAALLFILVSPLGQMASALSQLHSSLGSLQRINEILDLPREDELDMANLLSPELLKTLEASAKPNAPAIDFDDVVFTYGTREFGQEMDDADSLVLHKLNLQVPEGKRVAIVGPSGAGKSTVLQLIERFYDVNRGAIRVFGKDIRDYSRSDLRDVLGYVEQDAPVLSGSLRENLTLGLGDVGDDRCMEALERVNLGYLATRSEQGLDGPVGESGASLSGGERQRLAIARALLSNKRILLFDEATANLDSHNERQIGDVLRNMAGNRTVLVVAHRLSTIMDADLIHVLEHGRLVASGTHSELVVKSQIYRNLASEQHLA